MQIILEHSDVSCFGQSNGFLFVRVQGGQAPYVISWEDSDGNVISTGISARNLKADTYTCTVTDSDGDDESDTVTITQPEYEAPIPELGMSLCEFQNCFLSSASCTAGVLGYKYFSRLPDEGIDCKGEQQKVEWLNNAIDDVKCWYPAGTQVQNGIVAEFGISAPLMSCSSSPSTMTVEATLVSSTDGVIATYPPTNTTTASSWVNDIVNSFASQVNSLQGYNFVIVQTSPNVFDITVTGSSQNQATLTFNVIITNLATCTITSGSWNPVSEGGSYSDTQADPNYITTDEPCLTASDVGIIKESIENIIAGCDVNICI